MYPIRRKRRLRKSAALRDLVQETHLHPHDFIVPLFVVEGKRVKEEIPSMPNIYRMSLDEIQKEVGLLWKMGLKGVLVFAKVEDRLKDNAGTEALNPDGLMQRAIQTIKTTVPEMVVFSDVALDPYSSFGHDGIVENNTIINDATVDVLVQMALSHAQAGADVVAPSDMMDGRIGLIRDALEDEDHIHTRILAYSAKYASAFYGPFRDAVGSSANLGKKDKRTYQMDPSNSDEALHEVAEDLYEGADIVMIKPGLPYLDIVQRIKTTFKVPVAVYQVSGEYAMIQAAHQNGWIDGEAVMMESLESMVRAGADCILTYSAIDAAENLSA